MADTYYPIQKGNFWKYNLKTGGSFTNEITECGADYYIATCSTGNQTSKVKLENGTHFSDSFEAASPIISKFLITASKVFSSFINSFFINFTCKS